MGHGQEKASILSVMFSIEAAKPRFPQGWETMSLCKTIY